MSEKLEDFDASVEVITADDVVVAVLYDGRPLAFNQDDRVHTNDVAAFRALYENGDALDVLSVEVDDDE